MNVKRIVLILAVMAALAALATVAFARSTESAGRARLVGTWKISVAESATGLPPFEALQTFNADGTMTETSSLLGKSQEGPAHGVWRREGDQYLSTFYLFVFDENGDSAGMVRVRARIHLDGPDHLTAQTAVDFIEPDGTIIPDIDSGPFEGTRLKVEPIQQQNRDQ